MANLKLKPSWFCLIVIFIAFSASSRSKELQSQQNDSLIEAQRSTAVTALQSGDTSKAISIFKQIVDKYGP